MYARPSDYHERVRNSRNFLASLFFGIIAGGIAGVLLGNFLEAYKTNYLVQALLLLFFVAVSYTALSFSHRSERIHDQYCVMIDPESFVALCDATLQQLQPTEEKKEEITQLIRSIRTTFADPHSVEASNSNIITVYLEKIRELTATGITREAREMLLAIQDLFQRLQGLTPNISKSAQQQAVGIFPSSRKVTSENQGEINLKRGRILRTILTIKFESNLDGSLLYPANCEVIASPFVDQKEYVALQRNMKQLFSLVSSQKEFLELGVQFVPSEEHRYWRQLRESYFEPLKHEIRDLNEKLLTELRELRTKRESETGEGST